MNKFLKKCNNTISFFSGEHPHLDIDDDEENHVLHLPIYNFDLDSPIYDFLYSDTIEENINALLNLSEYSLPTLEISYDADEQESTHRKIRIHHL